MNTIVAALQRISERDGRSVGVIGVQLGFSENYAYKLCSGERRPGVSFIAALLKAYPETTDDVMAYIQSISGEEGNGDSSE